MKHHKCLEWEKTNFEQKYSMSDISRTKGKLFRRNVNENVNSIAKCIYLRNTLLDL